VAESAVQADIAYTKYCWCQHGQRGHTGTQLFKVLAILTLKFNKKILFFNKKLSKKLSTNYILKGADHETFEMLVPLI